MVNSTFQCLHKITSMLIFFFVIGMFQNSSYAQSDRKNAKTLCMSAIQGYLPFWDVNDPQAVAQAKRRGLSERQCARLTERFSEQKIRSFKKDIQQKRGPSTNTKQERKNRQLFIDNKKLQKQIKQLKAAQKNLAKKSLGGINQKLKKQEALTDKNTLKIKNIEAISRQILDIKNQNDTILNQIGEWQDVIPRLEKNIKRLTEKVNNIEGMEQNPKDPPNAQNPAVKTGKNVRTPDSGEAGSKGQGKEGSFPIGLIVAAIFIGLAAGGGLVFLLARRSARKKEDELSLRQQRGRSRSQERGMSPGPMEGTGAGARTEGGDPIGNLGGGATTQIPRETSISEERNFDTLYRQSLRDPAAVQRLKELGVFGVEQQSQGVGGGVTYLVKDREADIAASDFWAHMVSESENKYHVFPGIKQNIKAGVLAADDGLNARRLFQGIYTIKKRSSFELQEFAVATSSDGRTFTVVQEGVLQLPL